MDHSRCRLRRRVRSHHGRSRSSCTVSRKRSIRLQSERFGDHFDSRASGGQIFVIRSSGDRRGRGCEGTSIRPRRSLARVTVIDAGKQSNVSREETIIVNAQIPYRDDETAAMLQHRMQKYEPRSARSSSVRMSLSITS